MTDDLPDEARLIDLLVLWWRYESSWSPVRGYPKACPSTPGYRASRQHDGENGAAETDARGKDAARIGAIINAMEPLYRAALYDLAKSRSIGAAVYRHPLMPTDREDRARVVARALELFGLML